MRTIPEPPFPPRNRVVSLNEPLPPPPPPTTNKSTAVAVGGAV